MVAIALAIVGLSLLTLILVMFVLRKESTIEEPLPMSEQIAHAVRAGGIRPKMAIPGKHPARRTRRSRSL